MLLRLFGPEQVLGRRLQLPKLLFAHRGLRLFEGPLEGLKAHQSLELEAFEHDISGPNYLRTAKHRQVRDSY